MTCAECGHVESLHVADGGNWHTLDRDWRHAPDWSKHRGRFRKEVVAPLIRTIRGSL